MQTVTLAEAQRKLFELVRDLPREGELLITDADKPVARLAAVSAPTSLREIKPQSVGSVLQPFPSPADDTLGEMLGSPR